MVVSKIFVPLLYLERVEVTNLHLSPFFWRNDGTLRHKLTHQDTDMSTNIKVQRICEYCGKEFTAKTTVTRFCSKQCNGKANKSRIKALKIEASNQATKQIRNKPMEELKAKAFLSISETSRLVGISRRTIYRMIERGDIKKGKAGRRTIIRRSDLELNIFGDLEKPGLTDFNSSQKTRPTPDAPQTIEARSPSNALPDPLMSRLTPFNYCTLTEVLEKHTISRRALTALLKRNKIQTIRKGKFVFVDKSIIDNILT